MKKQDETRQQARKVIKRYKDILPKLQDKQPVGKERSCDCYCHAASLDFCTIYSEKCEHCAKDKPVSSTEGWNFSRILRWVNKFQTLTGEATQVKYVINLILKIRDEEKEKFIKVLERIMPVNDITPRIPRTHGAGYNKCIHDLRGILKREIISLSKGKEL